MNLILPAVLHHVPDLALVIATVHVPAVAQAVLNIIRDVAVTTVALLAKVPVLQVVWAAAKAVVTANARALALQAVQGDARMDAKIGVVILVPVLVRKK